MITLVVHDTNRQGATACVNGQTVCNGWVGPSPEICDGIDNDCDGVIDDGPMPGIGEACCGGGVTACVDGTVVCANPGCPGDATCIEEGTRWPPLFACRTICPTGLTACGDACVEYVSGQRGPDRACSKDAQCASGACKGRNSRSRRVCASCPTATEYCAGLCRPIASG